ncbi:MAG: creatininase family protein [Gemmatimonadota bacterium]
MPRDPIPSLTRLWAEFTAPELAEFAGRDPVALLPLAAIEQHGPHLPVSTDLVICRGILDHARRCLPLDLPVLVLPEQATGASAEHAAFPGTLSVRPDTLERVVYEAADSLARMGLRRLVLFNTHGGNKHVIEGAGLRARTDHGMLVVKAHSFRFPRPDGVELPEREWDHGLHGGAVETAMLLYLRPDLVRRDRLENFPSLGEELAKVSEVVRPEGPGAFSWLAHDLNRHGVVGDARLASAELGKQLVEGYGETLAAVIRDARAFPLDRLRSVP